MYTEYILTSFGGTLTTISTANYAIVSPSAVTLSAGFSIVPSASIAYAPIRIRWNTSVNLNGYPMTIAGISINQDQVNQTGLFELMWDGTSYYLQYYPDFTSKPQETYGVTTITVPAGGGTLTIVPGADKRTYVLQGTTTLTSNYTVTGSTSGVTDGSAVRVVLAGGITIGANTVTIFGQSISSYDCLIGGAEVYAEFNSATSSYVATYVNRNIPLAKILTTGLGSGDNGKLVSYDFATNQFVASFLSAANLPSTFKGINITSTTIASGQILTANTTPIVLLPASGSTSTVEVPLLFVVRYIPATTAYATNTEGRFYYTGSTTQRIAVKSGMLLFSVAGLDVIYPDNFNATGTPERLLTPNSTLVFDVTSGNPTAGDGSLEIYTISTTLNL